MKTLLGFLRKEIYHITRDVKSLIVLFGIPIVQILIFGYAITSEIKNSDIAILDLSKDEMTLKFINKIESSGYFKIKSFFNSEKEIESEFKSGKIKIAMIIEKDFSYNLYKTKSSNIQVITDATEPNTATTLLHYIRLVLADFQSEINKNTQDPNIINTKIKMRFNEELKGVFLFVPGLITVILMLVSAMMTSISITKEKELGTMEVLLSSPIKPYHIIIAKVIPYLILSFINANIVLLIGRLVFGVPINGSLLLLELESIIFILTALSLGIMISTITSSQQVALMISLAGLMLPTMLLSGYIFPIENMPNWLQYLTYFIPARWFIVIIRGIMLKGIDLTFLWKETLVIFGFSIIFILISIKRYKVRL
jgi:ABC-2 type transport system permease protein